MSVLASILLGVTPPPSAGFQIILAGLSGGALVTSLGSVGVALIQERGRRRDKSEQAVISAAKNQTEGETVREANYRELAEQARKSAETAVNVIERSLTATQSLADRLQVIVDSQNQTITTLTQAQVAQNDVVRAITQDRDRTVEALQKAQADLREKNTELEQARADLREKNSELALLDDLLRSSRPRTAALQVVDTTGPIPTTKETPDGEA